MKENFHSNGTSTVKNKIENENQCDNEIRHGNLEGNKDEYEGCSINIATVEANVALETSDETKSKKAKSTTPAKKTVGPKSKAKKEEDSQIAEPKVKGKRGRKRKEDKAEATGETAGETKLKRTKGSSGTPSKGPKKGASGLSNFQLLTPPPSPPPPSEAELAEANLQALSETERKERLKSIPYYYEEMKEIFDYLCDRGVYWKNDLPKNKKYSNRDTKLLEKEVRKRVSEVLEQYPKEKEVMEAFENDEKKLKDIADREAQDHSNKDDAIDSQGGDAEMLGLSSP
ncbi:hypothetical protein TWF730_003196 [Orbilia blumenaviensis]|uniref:Uncharacterized protein n=1 Tax=Orbilia blumenaviensis TaxID=1796055 RepID=A0AAV9U7P3_9PEZI